MDTVAQRSGGAEALVDMCGLFYDRAGWEAYLLAFARRAPNYLWKFGHRFCAMASTDSKRFYAALETDAVSAVALLVESGGGLDQSADHYVASLEAQGVTHQVIHGCPWLDHSGRNVNGFIADLARRQPDRLSAWAGLSLERPQESAHFLYEAIQHLGMRGATLIPFWEGVPASAPALAPIYEGATELDVPVWIHVGNNFNSRVSLDVSHWRHIDAVAVAYPRLKIVMGHGGWPWVTEALSLCLRHPNVYLEFSSHRPAHMTKAGSGWEPLIHMAPAVKDKVLFGTSSWVSPKSIRELADEVATLPIDEATKRAWIGGNAVRILGLRAPVTS